MINEQLPNMDDRTLIVNHTNLYQPHPLGITNIAISENKSIAIATRGYVDYKDINQPFSLIDLYEGHNHVATITEYEDISGIALFGNKYLVSASRQATMNIYNLKSCEKIKIHTTDYGPITCMRYSKDLNLLITASELGLIAVYQMIDGSIKFVDKLVKVNESITSLDFYCKKRSKKVEVSSKKSIPRGPMKRRKNDADSTDESDDASEDDAIDEEDLLDSHDIIIYGASESSVAVWDYHRKTIIDKIVVDNEVLSIRTLSNGDVILGDKAGYMAIYDHNTLTCRQSEKLFDGPVLCLDVNSKSSKIVASGEDRSIAILEVDKSTPEHDEYKLFELLRDHKSPITCAEFLSKNDFITASQDGKLIRFRLTRNDSKKSLHRHISRPPHTDRISLSNGEILLIYSKSILIYKLEDIQQANFGELQCPAHIELSQPRKGCTLRVGQYVHSATFNDKWVCYSTKTGTFIHSRSDVKHRQTTTEKLVECNRLELTQDGRYLMAIKGKRIYVIKLVDSSQSNEVDTNRIVTDEQDTENDSENNKKKDHEVVFAYKVKGIIKKVIHMTQSNRLVLYSGAPLGSKNHIYQFQLGAGEAIQDPILSQANGKRGAKSKTTTTKTKVTPAKPEVSLVSRVCFPRKIIQMVSNPYDKNDYHIYLYTSSNQLIICDTRKLTNDSEVASQSQRVTRRTQKFCLEDYLKELASKAPIGGAHTTEGESNDVQELVLLSSKVCILHDGQKFYKLDVEHNEIVDENDQYSHITLMNNHSMFKRPCEILIVSGNV